MERDRSSSIDYRLPNACCSCKSLYCLLETLRDQLLKSEKAIDSEEVEVVTDLDWKGEKRGGEETSVATVEPTVYESLSSTSVLQPLDNHPAILSTSVHLTHSNSKPVKRSSQLIPIIDNATPAIDDVTVTPEKYQRFAIKEENQTPTYKAPSLKNIITRTRKYKESTQKIADFSSTYWA